MTRLRKSSTRTAITEPIESDSAIRVEEAASLLNVSPDFVRNLIQRGDLPTSESRSANGEILLPLQAVRAFRSEFKTKQRAHVAEIIRLSEELGLYDLDYGPEFTSEDCSESPGD